jgi:hypothetical protein
MRTPIHNLHSTATILDTKPAKEQGKDQKTEVLSEPQLSDDDYYIVLGRIKFPRLEKMREDQKVHVLNYIKHNVIPWERPSEMDVDGES